MRGGAKQNLAEPIYDIDTLIKTNSKHIHMQQNKYIQSKLQCEVFTKCNLNYKNLIINISTNLLINLNTKPKYSAKKKTKPK